MYLRCLTSTPYVHPCKKNTKEKQEVKLCFEKMKGVFCLACAKGDDEDERQFNSVTEKQHCSKESWDLKKCATDCLAPSSSRPPPGNAFFLQKKGFATTSRE